MLLSHMPSPLMVTKASLEKFHHIERHRFLPPPNQQQPLTGIAQCLGFVLRDKEAFEDFFCLYSWVLGPAVFVRLLLHWE